MIYLASIYRKTDLKENQLLSFMPCRFVTDTLYAMQKIMEDYVSARHLRHPQRPFAPIHAANVRRLSSLVSWRY